MISLISDVHIKTPGDDPHVLFMKFLNHELVKKSDKIILLGDIFDLLVGGNQAFIKTYKDIFDKIEEYLNEGKEIYYLEGNHDFHLERFFKNLYQHNTFFFSKKMMKIRDDGIEILICHGDDIEIENPSYERYSKIIKSYPIKVLAERILPFSLTELIGSWASSRSRKKNIEKYESKTDEIRTKFRKSSEIVYKESHAKMIISGHSHVKDVYTSENGFIYLNNGYFPKEKTYLFIDNGSHRFINLD